MTTVMTTDEVPVEPQEHDRFEGVAEILAVGLRRWRNRRWRQTVSERGPERSEHSGVPRTHNRAPLG